MNQMDGMKPTYSIQNPLVNKLMTPAKKIARYNIAVNKGKKYKINFQEDFASLSTAAVRPIL